MTSNKHITRTQRSILSLIACGISGMTISKASIADKTNCCEKTADRLMANLIRRGLVVSAENRLPNGASLPNTYRLTARGHAYLQTGDESLANPSEERG